MNSQAKFEHSSLWDLKLPFGATVPKFRAFEHSSLWDLKPPSVRRGATKLMDLNILPYGI